MVFRYWGKGGVVAEDFAALIDPGLAGIRTGDLVNAVVAQGWTALPLPGTSAQVADHLAQGRPVIALVGRGSGSYHYVVLVAWANGWVIVHDPNVGPFRAVREEEFLTSWAGSDDWALLVLPPRGFREPVAPDPFAAADTESPATLDGCGAMVAAGILLAQEGDTAEADLKFLAAQSLCPASAAPLRERAGLRFRAEDWSGASRLAEQALTLDPSDAHAWRLLAGSRFLAGDDEGALRAWNHLSEPRTDLTRIDGLARIRYSAVAGQLDLPPGRLLTPRVLRQARRRLAEVPAQQAARLSLKPMPEGYAQVTVALLEHPAVFNGPWDIGGTGIRALTEHELAVDVASPTGNGELWVAGWRWQEDRPRVSLALAVPAGGGRPGIWRLDASWERQAYAAQARTPSDGPTGTTNTEVVREERRRSALSFSDWLGADVRVEIGVGLDRWVDRGPHVSLEGSLETRWAGDRLSLRAGAARWIGLASGVPFGTGDVLITWSSSGLEQRDAWQGCLGVSSASSRAPLALWSGAGTGNGRAPLLRAHPLLNGGIVQGRVFGRALAHATVERQVWPWRLGPLRIGWALFADGAKPWDTGRLERIPWQADVGTGLRMRVLGANGQLRIDAARALDDGTSVVSIGWQVP